ncbi:MAG TPA: hypothetical protein VGW39_13115 [Chthoniobacterales bacterium]|nr:hypothetical protein [Chthoniobacterales bacterium]
MRTPGLFHLRSYPWRILAAFAAMALALPAQATFHFMQIEQVIGGVNGDTTAQAVQLRMRFAGQDEVNGAELVAFDAAGNNPITLATFPNDVTVANQGSRILITTSNFAAYEATPIVPDFTMDAIPASYLAAGRLAFQKFGIRWSVSWGGAGYTGPNTGTFDNDADGNFGPPFAGALPSTSTSALRFNGAAGDQSTNNAADYSVTPGAATFTNNNGDSTLVIGVAPTPTPTATPTPPPPTPTATPPPPTPTPTASIPPGTPTPTPTAPPGTLGNISTRLRVETGDNILIAGFIITGTQPKRIIVRAIGPSLPLAGALADPILELRDAAGGLILSNDNWRIGGQEAEIIATGIPPISDLESAIVATLPANSSAYTAVMRGVNNGTGIGVVEAYDLDQTVDSKLANISTRGLVQTGDNVLIGGLIILGQNPLRVIVRAIGPSLPVPGALADPTLELRDGDGNLVASNDNWRDDPLEESEINATGIPPTNDQESAIVRNLAPGPYTAIVRGANNTTGVAVVEAYGLN